MDQNLINKILLIVILLLIANYLSDGSIINTLRKYIERLKYYTLDCFEGFKNTGFYGRTFEGIKSCNNTTPDIIHDQDFNFVYKSDKPSKIDDPNIKKLYHFLQSLVTTNNNHYEMTNSNSKPTLMSKNDKDSLVKHLQKTLNCGEFRFMNLVIIDPIVYFDNSTGKELKPYRVVGDVYINKEPIGKITMHIEMFIRMDSMFYGPIKSGFPTITRIKLIRKDKISSDIPKFNDFDDYYESTENSLIPDEIKFSTESNIISETQTTSEYVTTEQN